MRPHGSPSELEHRRWLAVQRVEEGYEVGEVAEFLGVDPSSVRRWVAAFRSEGARSLAARPVAGRPPKLSSTQEKIVLRWLLESPTEHGFATELWTGPRLAQLIEEQFGVRMHHRYMSTWLRARGFTPQLPQRVPRERDPERITRWLTNDWPRIKKKALRQNACLALIDESGLLMAPLLRRSWAPRGQRPVLLQRGQHRQKVSLAAALWLSPRRETIGLFFETLPNAYFDNFRSAAFLKMLLEHLGRHQRVIVIWDGGTMHKGEPINALLAEAADRLILERFPPYAPMLNPIEPLWSWLKYGRLCNFAARDAHHLNEIASAELRTIENDQERLRSFFHASDLPLPRALFF